MTLDMWIVLITLAVALFFFITEWVRVDVVALCMMVVLMLTQLLTVNEAVAGFANSSVLTIVFLFVVGGAVMQTGLADTIGYNILRVAGQKEVRLIVVLMLATAFLSSFMSNTGTVALLFPSVVILARQAKISPAKLLMPLSFGSMLGGAATMIGTPPNLLVNDVLKSAGLTQFSFFSFTPLGVALSLFGTALMVVVGRHLLPNEPARPETEQNETAKDLADRYHLLEHMKRLVIQENSPLVGQSLAESNLRHGYGLTVLKVMRPSDTVRLSDIGHNLDTRKPRQTPLIPTAGMVFQAKDELIVEGQAEQMEQAAGELHCVITPAKPKDIKAIISKELGIAEIVLPPRSNLIDKTLADSNFANTYKLTVLEVHRPPHGEALLLNTPLRFGDTLLVQGWWEHILALRSQRRDFVLLGNPEEEMGPPHRHKAGTALFILLVMIVVMVTGYVPGLGEISVMTVALMAGLAMVLTGCLDMEEAYASIDWKSVVLIGGILPISTAMEKVGLVSLMATTMVNNLGGSSPYIILLSFFLLTGGLTQLISNTAAAVIIAPLALAIAQQLNIQPQALLMTVAVAASCAFLTPVGSPTNTIIMGVGNYRFKDFFKAGLPMFILCMVLTVLLLPLLFPF